MAPAPEMGLVLSRRDSEGGRLYTGAPVEKDENEVEVLTTRLGLHCTARWAWSTVDKSKEVTLQGESKEAVLFHPHWSNGTAGVRASSPLSGGLNYWEIHVGERVFGTSLMFGVSTKQARLHANEFKNILGEDRHGWALSHRGCVHHDGESRPFCRPFPEYTAVTVGVLVDMDSGEMTFFKDGHCLGVAFRGLNQIPGGLYPTVCSTAAKTSMRAGRRLRTFSNLQDRCRHVIVSAIMAACEGRRKGNGSAGQLEEMVNTLPVPNKVMDYITGCGG